MLAAFMAGVAANVTSFNTVVTYDLIQAYFVKDRDSGVLPAGGRMVTIAGILVSVGTAFIAKGYSNIMNYIQTLFSIFNAPLFATFIIAMFWKRATAWGGFFSLVAGTAAAYAVNRLNAYHTIFHFGSALSASFWQAIIAFLADAAVMVVVSLVTKPKPTEELEGWSGGYPARTPTPTPTHATSCGGARRCCWAASPSPSSSSSTSSSPRRSEPCHRADRPSGPGHVRAGAAGLDRGHRRGRGPGGQGRQPVRHPPADRRPVPGLRPDPGRTRARRLAPRQDKAAGINIDLWTGIGMLVFGALMVFWALTKPTCPSPTRPGEGSGRIRRAPAT